MDDEVAESFENMALRQERGGARARGKGRGGRGGRGGAGGSQSRAVSLSRALSRLLRHQAANAGIQLDREGFAPLDRVLQWGPLRSLSPTLAEIQSLVRDSDKQRFALKLKPGQDEEDTAAADDDPSRWLIRANQGHSIKVESDALLRPIALPDDAAGGGGGGGGSLPEGAEPVPPTVIHGTYFAFWPAIVEAGGLRTMGRNHVHCCTGLPGGSGEAEEVVVSGMRRDAELLIYVDVERSIREAGVRWWMSDNGVVLTSGDEEGGLVPLRFFREVVGRREDVGVLWKDGVKVADLPPDVKGKVPRGKGGAGGSGGGRGKGRGRGQ